MAAQSNIFAGVAGYVGRPNETGKIGVFRRSGTIIPLRIDPESGRLAKAGNTLNLPFPVCAEFVPAN